MLGAGWRTARPLELDVEHLGEVLAEAVAGGALDGAPVGGDKAFHGGCVQTTSKLLLLTLHALDHGHGQKLFVYPSVQIENLQHLLVGFGLVCESAVPLAPQELAGAEEGDRVFELPSHDVAPLVQPERQVSVAADPLGVQRVHEQSVTKIQRGKDMA